MLAAYKINLSPVPPATPTLGKLTLVLLVVDTVPNKPVVPDSVVMSVICPVSCKLETDKVLLVLFHDKFADCKIDVAALPINN